MWSIFFQSVTLIERVKQIVIIVMKIILSIEKDKLSIYSCCNMYRHVIIAIVIMVNSSRL